MNIGNNSMKITDVVGVVVEWLTSFQRIIIVREADPSEFVFR